MLPLVLAPEPVGSWFLLTAVWAGFLQIPLFGPHHSWERHSHPAGGLGSEKEDTKKRKQIKESDI